MTFSEKFFCPFFLTQSPILSLSVRRPSTWDLMIYFEVQLVTLFPKLESNITFNMVLFVLLDLYTLKPPNILCS